MGKTNLHFCLYQTISCFTFLLLSCSGGDNLVSPMMTEESNSSSLQLPLPSDGPIEEENEFAWTVFTPSPDSRIIYVSSSVGNDAYDGLSENQPKATIAAAKALLENNNLSYNGTPQWLLLKSGDSWNEGLGQWKLSGRSPTEPLLIGSYGIGARPLLRTGPYDGVSTHGGGGSPAQINYVAIAGIHFQARTWGGTSAPNGVVWLQASDGLLIEDCLFASYETNLIIQAYPAPSRHANFHLRGNVIVDAYNTGTGSVGHGLYMYGVDNAVIEGNVFDHNGWNEAIPGSASIFRHSMYLQNGNTGVVVRNNIIANGSSHGVQLRAGGIVDNNLFIRNSIALSVGGGNNPDPGGVVGTITNNVIVEGKNISPTEIRGWGIQFANVSSAVVSNNLIANQGAGQFPNPITIDALKDGDTTPAVGVHNLQLIGNTIYNWGGTVIIHGNAVRLTGLSLQGNKIDLLQDNSSLVDMSSNTFLAAISSSGNRFFNQTASANSWFYVAGIGSMGATAWFNLLNDTTSSATASTYLAPNRSIAGYNARLGGPATYEAFMAECRQQSKQNWRRFYTAGAVNKYLREGFGLQYQ